MSINHGLYNKFLAKCESQLSQLQPQITEWFVEKYRHLQPIFYCSVDVRYSGFKVAPVDTNLFPAGFNNIGRSSGKAAQLAANEYINRYYPQTQNILLIGEDFTRNLWYSKNILTLYNMLKDAGYEVACGSLTAHEEIKISNLTIMPLAKRHHHIATHDQWTPDLVILNNDLISGIPHLLQDIAQPVIPSSSLGWHQRRKHNHFTLYNQVAKEFGEAFKFDPWLLSCDFTYCQDIDFKHLHGLDVIASAVDQLVNNITEKYNQYSIKSTPYVYVKADNGTFGMGVMSVNNGEEVLSINKQRRHSMHSIKYGVTNSEVIIQEGIPTHYTTDEGAPAEHIPYFVGGKVISTLIRANLMRDQWSNLNSANATIQECKTPIRPIELLVAELAALTAALENQQV